MTDGDERCAAAVLGGPSATGDVVTCGAMDLQWHSAARLAVLRFTADTHLTAEHGTVLADSLQTWIGAGNAPFALLADARGVLGTDGGYRTATGKFFGQHRDAARIALVNLGPVIRVVAEMFRIGIRLHLKTFADEAAARDWLRTQGIAA
jgi:hypothetical protein